MPYATVSHVQSRNAARGTFTATTIPTDQQVVEFILESGAQLDQWLYAGGYAAPFDQSIASGGVATTGQLLLRRWNVTGAALMVEESAQSSDQIDNYRKMWDEIKEVILNHNIDIQLPMNPARANPRQPNDSAIPQALNIQRAPVLGIYDL